VAESGRIASSRSSSLQKGFSSTLWFDVMAWR
jgi:hypothetical protein